MEACFHLRIKNKKVYNLYLRIWTLLLAVVSLYLTFQNCDINLQMRDKIVNCEIKKSQILLKFLNCGGNVQMREKKSRIVS